MAQIDLGTIAWANLNSSCNVDLRCSYEQNKENNKTYLYLSSVLYVFANKSIRWTNDWVDLTGTTRRNKVISTYPNYITGGSQGSYYVLSTSTIEVGHNSAGVFPDTAVSTTFWESINGGQSATASTTLTSANIPQILRYPSLSISAHSRSTNSVSISYTATNATPEYVHAYNGGTFLGQFTGNPVTITGLSPATTYSDLKLYGYANGGFGSASNSISMTTYPNPADVSYCNVTNITDTTCTIQMGSTDPAHTNATEFRVLSEDAISGETIDFSKTVKGPYIWTNPVKYTQDITGLVQDTKYYAAVRVRTSDSNAWSLYLITEFNTLADQVYVWIKNSDEVWVKGKLWYKDSNGDWVKGKRCYIKDTSGWKKSKGVM